MAVVRVNTVQQRFMGTAAERAAMGTTTLKVGDSFIENDTGLEYLWSGVAWFKRIIPAA